MMKRLIFATAAALAAMSAYAVVPHRVNIPDVPGYHTLVGDFHIHTRFTDCDTWPSERVSEAAYEGLDFISMTDHIDTRHQHLINDFGATKVDQNSSYEIAAKSGKSQNVIVLHGAELTRGTSIFPGHFNVHFISDAMPICASLEAKDKNVFKDEFEKEETALLAGLREARKQGAFLVWNHPDWERQAHNETSWWPIHTRIFEEGLMDGIEIVNRFSGYDPEAFHWAVEKNLAIVTGTDCHKPMFQLIDYGAGEFRPMTIVFATERSEKGIREALEARRTAAFADGCIYGTRENIEPLFRASLELTDVKYSTKKISFKLRNNSSIPMVITKGEGSADVVYPRLFIIRPGEEMSMSITALDNREPMHMAQVAMNLKVTNWLTDVDTPLELCYDFTVPEKYR